ncbi:peptide ABC transporter substrate-binding protein [Clostridium estertheticum]|uniref:Peptide ABC transporter substrate-binding protein n=1 Tax=Clostridium estertheticum TaxID=238834 RepID=A0AA47I758_9CLOT|nr:peptide ABC transporter substrate-binding protein [Clostridium estertheticum]MBU3156081.1 peptide ABC transporter substrate-binding protein [Clostridium estertheticum]WAG60590.1 peptide ABC transporter substrate-binding protein [Clostridium estertheticum]
MKSKKIVSVLIVALVLSVALVGCGAKSGDSAGTTKSTETKLDADQTANILGYDYTSLDPAVISDMESFTTLTNVDEGLMREVTKDGKVISILAGADKMTVSADHKVYTFHIRASKWSDGKAVRAQDYVYGWQRLSNPKVSQDYLGFLNEMGVKGATETGVAKPSDLGVKAIDDNTFEVTLKSPSAYFETTLNFKGLVPQREDIVKKLGDQYGQDFKGMVYNGPFVVSDHVKSAKVVYTKNANYWDAANVKLTTVNAQIIDEPATYNKMFSAGELDMIVGATDYLKPLQTKATAGEISYLKGNDPSVYYFIFNNKTKALSNAKVRLALSLAYDRQVQINTVFKKHYVAEGIVPSKIMVGDEEFRKAVPEALKTVKDDPKKLLAEGLKELGLSSDASKVTLKLLMPKATSITTAQAQFIQAQYKKNLGINVSITYAVDAPSYFKARTAGEFDLCSGGWGADYNDVISFFNIFTSKNGNNNGKYNNPAYDALIEKGKTELDAKKRVAIFKEAEDLLVAKDAAVSPYYYKQVDSFMQTYLKGMYVPLFGGYYDLKTAYVSGK